MAQAPLAYNVPIVNEDGTPSAEFLRKWQEQINVNATIPALSTSTAVSAVLDLVTSTPGSLLLRTSIAWGGLASPSDATRFLNGAASPSFAQVKDTDLFFADNTTNNVSAAKHGFVPKAPAVATKYLDGTGAWSTPSGGGGAFNNQRHGGTLGTSDTTAVASVANCFTATGVMNIYQVLFGFIYAASCTYKAYIATVSGGGAINNTILTLTQIGGLLTPAAGYGATLNAGMFTAASPYVTAAATDYAVIVTRTDSTATTPTHVLRGTQTGPQPILGQWNQSRNSAVNPPIVGSTFSYFSALAFDIWIGWA
jgi:hypothetical protein